MAKGTYAPTYVVQNKSIGDDSSYLFNDNSEIVSRPRYASLVHIDVHYFEYPTSTVMDEIRTVCMQINFNNIYSFQLIHIQLCI